jgi:hypothetical protein
LIDDLIRARYPCTSVTEAMIRFMTCKQLENKSLADSVKQFKGRQDSLVQNMGKEFIFQFVKNMKEHKEETGIDKQNQMQKGSYAQWTVFMLMKNSDQGKHGLLMTILMLSSPLEQTNTQKMF